MNNGRFVFVLLIATGLLVLLASASYVCAEDCLTMGVATEEPWTIDPKDDGTCPDGYTPRTHEFEKQCFQCPEGHRFGYVNWVWTCYQCPEGYSLRTFRDEEKCAKCSE